MFVNEMFSETPSGYRTEKDDNTVMKLGDMRKTKLTLAHLNKLRMASDLRKFEHEDKLKKVSKQYKAPAAAGGMGGLPTV
jgi:hypothetical protein